MLKNLCILLLFSFPIHLCAQNNILTGNVFDNDNRAVALEGATIKNLSNQLFALSDKDGHFAVAAKIGDLVTFSRVGYVTDTIYLINLFPKNVYLLPQVNNLKTVDVTGTKLSPYLNLRDPNAAPSKSIDYSKERGGLRLNLGYGKFRKERLKIQELEENQRYEQEIAQNFNEETIKKLVNFQGLGIKDFIQLYRPTVEQVKAERPFNYAYHAAKSYAAWLKLPPDQRKLPSLYKLKPTENNKNL